MDGLFTNIYPKDHPHVGASIYDILYIYTYINMYVYVYIIYMYMSHMEHMAKMTDVPMTQYMGWIFSEVLAKAPSLENGTDKSQPDRCIF